MACSGLDANQPSLRWTWDLDTLEKIHTTCARPSRKEQHQTSINKTNFLLEDVSIWDFGVRAVISNHHGIIIYSSHFHQVFIESVIIHHLFITFQLHSSLYSVLYTKSESSFIMIHHSIIIWFIIHHTIHQFFIIVSSPFHQFSSKSHFAGKWDDFLFVRTSTVLLVPLTKIEWVYSLVLLKFLPM